MPESEEGGVPQESTRVPPSRPERPGERIPQIDYLKAFAIIAVIILHTYPVPVLLAVGSPYHLWHAVPLFILISGFTLAYGYRKRDARSLSECYDPDLVSRRFLRLLVPYAMFWVFEIAVLSLLTPVPLDPGSLLLNFLYGGTGWGSYFVPVILQGIFIIPLLYFISLRRPGLMVAGALVVTILFEIWAVSTGNDTLSSVIYLRYLFAGALGVWLVLPVKRPFPLILLGGIASLTYITLACYTSLFPPTSTFYQYEGINQFPAFAWTLILAMAGLAYLPGYARSGIRRMLSGIGKASWHIFLVQMLYFLFPAGYAYDLLSSVLIFVSRNILGLPLPWLAAVLPPALGLFKAGLNILICAGPGYAWYSAEKKAAGLISGKSSLSG